MNNSGTVMAVNIFPQLLQGFVANLNGEADGPAAHMGERLSLQLKIT